MEPLPFRVITSYWTKHKGGEPVLAEHCPDWAAHGESSAHLLSLLEYHHTQSPTPSTASELNSSSKLLALPHLLLQNTGVHLFLEQESTRNSCVVLGGVQKSWNPGKEIQEVSVEPTVNIVMGSTEPSTALSGILHMSIKELSGHTTKHGAKLLADFSCPCHQNAISCSRSHWKTRIPHASLDEGTCCSHFQLPCRRDNSAPHHSEPGTAPARLNKVCESLR